MQLTPQMTPEQRAEFDRLNEKLAANSLQASAAKKAGDAKTFTHLKLQVIAPLNQRMRALFEEVERTSAPWSQRGKLTKKFLMALPPDSWLVSNTGASLGVARGGTPVVQKYLREVLWGVLAKSGWAGRTCYVFPDEAGAKAFQQTLAEKFRAASQRPPRAGGESIEGDEWKNG